MVLRKMDGKKALSIQVVHQVRARPKACDKLALRLTWIISVFCASLQFLFLLPSKSWLWTRANHDPL